MGPDIADLNNDGSLEIFTTDMLPLFLTNPATF